jgi:hypothetical protein
MSGTLVPEFTFGTFRLGPHNRWAHSVGVAVAETPGMVYNPLFIYGGPGSGKTRLLLPSGCYSTFHRGSCLSGCSWRHLGPGVARAGPAPEVRSLHHTFARTDDAAVIDSAVTAQVVIALQRAASVSAIAATSPSCNVPVDEPFSLQCLSNVQSTGLLPSSVWS